jgi:Na+/proline symporter
MGGKYFRLKMTSAYALFAVVVGIWSTQDDDFVRFAITYLVIWLVFFVCFLPLLKEDAREYYEHFTEARKADPKTANKKAINFLMFVVPAILLGPLFVLCAIPFAWTIPTR